MMTAPQRDMSLWRGAGVAHKNRSKTLRDAAYRDPNATCWLCGKTLAEGPKYKNGRPSIWHADHVVAGDPRSPLRVAHSLCNERRGRAGAKREEPRSPNG